MRVILNWDVLVGYVCHDAEAIENIALPTRTIKNTFTTDYIVVRAVRKLMSIGKTPEAQVLVNVFLGSKKKDSSELTRKVRTLPVAGDIEIARRLFLDHSLDIGFDLTDWTTVAVMRRHKIEAIITKDENFTRVQLLGDERLPKISHIYEPKKLTTAPMSSPPATTPLSPPPTPEPEKRRNTAALIAGLMFVGSFFAALIWLRTAYFVIHLGLLGIGAFFILDYVDPERIETLAKAIGNLKRAAKSSD